MALSFGKRDAQRMLDVLDPEYAEMLAEHKVLKKSGADEARLNELTDLLASAEDFGKAALAAAFEVIQEKAKFTVVGQVKQPDKDGKNHGDKIALDWYATEKQATEDALKLTYSSQTHEEAFGWVLPIWHGTPANWYAGRKKDKQLEAVADESYRNQELQRRLTWLEEHEGEPMPGDWTVWVAAQAETDECFMCDGTGRIANDSIPRRKDRDYPGKEREEIA